MAGVEYAVSVIVASHRSMMIDRLAVAFTDEVTGGIPCEIIVVADYPADAFSGKYPEIRWLHLDNISISAKRNLGVRNAHAPVIAFIDDDCKPQKNWIPAAMSFLNANPQYAAVEGRTVIEKTTHGSGMEREYRRLEKPGYRTNNIFYRKDVFLKCGGFDERFTVQREDLDLAFSVIEQDYGIGYNPEIQIEHCFRHWEKWDLLKNCINRRFDPLLLKKHPELYRAHVRTPFPPALLILFILHFMLLFSLPYSFAWITGITDACAVTALAYRRAGKKVANIHRIPVEWISTAAAPLVLAGALLYGSIRWKRFLIW